MPSLINATTTNGLVTSADNSGSLQLQTNNGTTAVTIDTGQNVGIGTSSPASKLAILESTNGNSILNVRNTNSGSSATSILALGNDGALNGAYLVLNSSANTSGGAGNSLNITNGFNAPMTFATNGTERMRITSGGGLCVGGTGNPYFQSIGSRLAGNLFQVADNTGAYDLCGYYRNGSTGFIQTFWYNSSSSGSASAGSQVGSISITASATAYNTSSDYRLKENIAPMTGALDTVAKLKPVTYNWKVDGSAGQGFIAHELQAVVPDCVTGEKDAVDEEGKPVYQGVDTSFLVATLTAAIQELKAELDATKAEVQALKESK